VLNVPVVLGTLLKESTSKQVNLAYSHFNYWLENIVFLSSFFVFELLLVVPVYLKNIIVMGAYTYGMFASLGRMMLWIVVGLPYTIIMVFWDVQLLFNILKMTKGCKHASDAADDMTVKPLEEEVQIKIC
jgi:hypothetical protein